MEDESAIEEMVNKLDKLKEKLPQHDAFGSDNWQWIKGAQDALGWVTGDYDPPVTDSDLE